MFDPGIANVIDGESIDRPFNAITLTGAMHWRFGELSIYFEPPPAELNCPEHTYIIKATKTYSWNRSLPIERTLFLSANRTIDPPNRRLLEIHRACALILHLSGAAEYISQILRDEDEGLVKSDGSTELGRILASRFGKCMAYAPEAIAT
jgi:HNH endonuclease